MKPIICKTKLLFWIGPFHFDGSYWIHNIFKGNQTQDIYSWTVRSTFTTDSKAQRLLNQDQSNPGSAT